MNIAHTGKFQRKLNESMAYFLLKLHVLDNNKTWFQIEDLNCLFTNSVDILFGGTSVAN